MSTVRVSAGGHLELGDVNGCLLLQGSERDPLLSAVNGSLPTRNVIGDIDLTGPVNGPLDVHGARKLSGAGTSPLRGEVKLAELAEVDRAGVNGNLAIGQVSDAVRLAGERPGPSRQCDWRAECRIDRKKPPAEGRLTGNSL